MLSDNLITLSRQLPLQLLLSPSKLVRGFFESDNLGWISDFEGGHGEGDCDACIYGRWPGSYGREPYRWVSSSIC
jgi:hypothetical protein